MGRYKLNSRLGLDIDLDTRTLTHDDIIALVKELVSLPQLLGMPEELDDDIKAITPPRRCRCRASRSRTTSTSTSTSATAGCAPSAS